MKKLHVLTLALTGSLILAACSSPATPPLSPPRPVELTPSSCEVVRVTLSTGRYSPAFGGAAGVFVPAQGLSLAIPVKQLECRRDGVFQPFNR